MLSGSGTRWCAIKKHGTDIILVANSSVNADSPSYDQDIGFQWSMSGKSGLSGHYWASSWLCASVPRFPHQRAAL
jgi:hypothetical protein